MRFLAPDIDPDPPDRPMSGVVGIGDGDEKSGSDLRGPASGVRLSEGLGAHAPVHHVKKTWFPKPGIDFLLWR